ncbi:gfo/Idh/MocA family oxidoreductase [Actinomadura spongiicola]|uniref:Gfo/Idh/MocA family oxidoreductase n=1 Tax=Actinomadura spongiicola TaxID=2303421 RepID=A0A372GPN6_9ACTN|nr:Gfo/Idh/MocA family oxidoreductase [Actinomadura spongiicola]RFS87357.1 gfo/Idh/MocA family oxidoreductase [Actinomadura spongiicola]
MNGVTGRMGRNQHLIRSILAIRDQGGLAIDDGTVIWPEPVLIGRDPARLGALAEEFGLKEWSTDLQDVLRDPEVEIYFDAQLTSVREPAVRAAIAAGKHVYAEKPLTGDLRSTLDLARAARDAGVKNGIVQDKLFLPGLRKLRRLVESGFFGRILSVRGEFGYWVFPGPDPAPQRPSWNYRSADGGGIISDMFCHWEYVLNGLFGAPRAVSVLGATHIPERIGEDGRPYDADAEDAAYATFELDGGVVVQLNSSWCVRVQRGEVFELQVDGTEGSAVAGLQNCLVQPAATTPRSTWNPDLPDPIDHRAGWQPLPATETYDNAFKVQWERFLRHIVLDEPFPWDFLAAARGIQLAELAARSWQERRWVTLPELSL